MRQAMKIIFLKEPKKILFFNTVINMIFFQKQKGEAMSYQIIKLPLLLVFFVLLSCSSNRPLNARGLNADERRHFIVQNGYGVPDDIKKSFLDGFGMIGMDQEFIFQLYGAPDRTSKNDTEWEYVNNKGDLITGFIFEDKKIVKITGDPRGGVPLPQAE